ncbi:MAG: NUDIX domain-containing protein [Bacteroidota bacterium]
MMKTIDKIAWIYLRDGKILSTRSKGKERFYIPGGKREVGEADEDTLVREIREELSVEIVAQSIGFWGEYRAQADSHPEGIEVIMQCYEAEYEGELSAAAEIEQLAWLGYDDRERVSAVDKIIFDVLRAENRLAD